MLWFLYSDENMWSGSSFAKGIEKIGDEYRFRNTMGWTNDDFRKCDIAVVFGWREAQQRCIRSNKINNVPVIVIDLGYVDRFDDFPDVEREHSFLQVNIGDTLNIIPKQTCPADRFEKLKLSYPGKNNKTNGYALFCGQMPGDASHPFKDAFSITSVVQEIQRRIPNIEVKYRAHPKVITNKVDRRAIEEDFAGARCVLTYNSNSGHDALRYGLPIFCHESAPYSALASSLFTLNQLEDRIEDPQFPSKHQWEHYFKRLAYAQWSFTELANGECQEFIKFNLFGVKNNE